METLDQIIAAIGGVKGASASIALILELILRVIPSKKPLSILHLVGAVIKKAGAVLSKLGAICVAGGELLDKVLPQSIAEPK